MPDDRIYDAINLFKYSPVGLGIRNVGGDAAYQARYHRLARDVLNKLWQLWSADEIGFANLAPTLVGVSQVRIGANIRVNRRIEPVPSPTAYATAANQGKLAATSCNLVHEATHLVRDIDCYPEEESLCRAIQQFYFDDLQSPQSYRSRVTGTNCTAQFLPSTPFFATYQERRNRLLSHELIDSIFAIDEYRDGHGGLECDETAQFVARCRHWWGGLTRRWPSTRGYYLRSLGSRGYDDYAFAILEILESFTTPASWREARPFVGDLEPIRQGLTNGYHSYERDFTDRISRLQERLGENFGIHAA